MRNPTSEHLPKNSSKRQFNSFERVKRACQRLPKILAYETSTLSHWCKASAQHGEHAFPGSGHQTDASGLRTIPNAGFVID
jgi:hypothetical protein